MNRMQALFLQRNPTFKGGLSIIGHSLGTQKESPASSCISTAIARVFVVVAICLTWLERGMFQVPSCSLICCRISRRPAGPGANKRSISCVDADFTTLKRDIACDVELGGGSQESLPHTSPRRSYSRQGSGSSTNFMSADYVVPPFMGAGYPSIR